jgi:predicted tellurium resistance membrane protein TerC
VISFLIGVAKALPRPPQSHQSLRLGIKLTVLAFVFNIIYTAILGWNQYPASVLELVLDILDGIVLVAGFFLMFKDIQFFKKSKYREE